MDATTSRRIGNIALVLAILILIWTVCAKLGFVPPIAHVREVSLFALVLVIFARAFRRRPAA
jgi:TRAP-type C4-dicarboxylate transport system permease small subunit